MGAAWLFLFFQHIQHKTRDKIRGLVLWQKLHSILQVAVLWFCPFLCCGKQGSCGMAEHQRDLRSHGPTGGTPQTSITLGYTLRQAPGGIGNQEELFHPKAAFLSFFPNISGQLLFCLVFMEVSVSKLHLGRVFSSRIGLRLLLNFLLK